MLKKYLFIVLFLGLSQFNAPSSAVDIHPTTKTIFGSIRETAVIQTTPPAKPLQLETPKLEEPGIVGFELRVGLISSPIIKQVFKNSPAESAGLKEGDVLLAVDGQELAGKTRRQVDNAIPDTPGTKVTFTVLRNSKIRQVSVVVAALSDVPRAHTPIYQTVVNAWNNKYYGMNRVSQVDIETPTLP